MKATLILVVLALVFTSNALEATCMFDGDSFEGAILLSEAGGRLSFAFDFEDPNHLLYPTGNAIHVHQFGFINGEGCGADFTGGHYNPVLNYGELSGHFGRFDNESTLDFSFESEQISLLGEFGILGRSLVIHHGVTGARLGCCNIIVTDVTGLPTDGITRFEEGIGMCGENVLIVQDGDNITITNNNEDDFVFLFLLPRFPACFPPILSEISTAPAGTYLNMSAGEQLMIDSSVMIQLTGNDGLALTGNNPLAGFSCVVVPLGDYLDTECQEIILKSSQENVNDVYEETDMTEMTEMTGDMTDASGEMTDMTDEMTDEMTDMTDMTDMTGSNSQAGDDDDDDDDDSSTVSLFTSAVFTLAALL